MPPLCWLHLNSWEDHQDSLHCHQVEEEVDVGLHYLYFQWSIGPSCCPPVSWCKRVNVDNAWLKSERFLTGSCHFLTCWERSTNFACCDSILNLTFGRCHLVLQERPTHDKLLHLDCFGSSVYGKHDLARIGHGFLCSPSLQLLFKLWASWYCLFSGSFPYLWPWGPFLIICSGNERSPPKNYETSIGNCFKRCPHVQWTMLSLQHARHAVHWVLESVSNSLNSSTLPTSWIIILWLRTERFVVLLLISLKMSVRVVVDLLSQFANTRALSMFWNRMWQSLNSEVHVHVVQDCLLVIWLVTVYNGLPISITNCFVSNVEAYALMTRTCLGTVWHIVCVFQQRVSPFYHGPFLTSTLKLLLSSDERVCGVLVSTTGCTVLSCLTASSWNECVSISWERYVLLPSCAVLVLVPTTGCTVLSVLKTGCTVLSWSGSKLVGSIVNLWIVAQLVLLVVEHLLNQILFSNHVLKGSLVEAEVTHIPSRIWRLQFPS